LIEGFLVVDVLTACRELEDHLTDSCHLLGSHSNVGARDSLDTGGSYNLMSPSGTQQSEGKTPSPLPRSGRRSQRGLHLSSSMNGLCDVG